VDGKQHCSLFQPDHQCYLLLVCHEFLISRFVKYFFAYSSLKWMSVKVLLQQYDLPLRINISLNGFNDKHGTKHFHKTFIVRGWSLDGLKTLSVK